MSTNDITAKQAAAILGIGVRRVQTLAAKGKLACTRIPDPWQPTRPRYMFDRAAVEALAGRPPPRKKPRRHTKCPTCSCTCASKRAWEAAE